MPNQPVLHPFLNLPGTSQIIALGRIRENSRGGNEVQLETCFRQDIFNKKVPPISITTWIGAGQLGLLSSGQRFRNGVQVNAASSLRYRGKVSIQNKTMNETLGRGKQGRGLQSFPSRPVEGATGWLLRHSIIENKSSGSHPPFTIFLPTLELIRALFASSSEMLKQIFDGRRDSAVTRGRFAIDWDRSSIGPDGWVIINADRALKDKDARMIAMIVADESQKLLRFFHSIHQLLSTDPNFRTSSGTYIAAEWPWDDSIELEFEGRWIERVDGQKSPRFVVTKIEKIFLASRPSGIEVRYPNETIHGPELPQSSGRKAITPLSRPVLRSDRSPDTSRRTVDIEIAGTEFPLFDDIEIRQRPGQTYRGRKDAGIFADRIDGEKSQSTDDPHYQGDASTGPASIRRGKGADDDDVELRADDLARKKTWEALNIVAQRKGWNVTFWDRVAGAVHVSSFNGTVASAGVPRLATIQTATGFKAVADIGSATGASASLGVVTSTRKLNPRSLAEAIFKQADACNWKWLFRRKVGWNPVVHQAVKGRRRPPKCWEDKVYYANLLQKWLT